MKSIVLRSNLIIHLFALAHVAIVLLFAVLGISDEIALTCLTGLMIILVAYTCRLPLDIAAVVALLFCFAGFFMGTKGAEWLLFLTQNHPSYLPNIICTFLTTEILGWSTYFIARRLKKGNQENSIEE